MSLINDALKKAARQRAEEQADVVAPMPGGGHRRPSKAGGPLKTQTIVLIAGGAVALIVVSAVITGIFIAGKSEQKTTPSAPLPVVSAPSPTPLPQKVSIQAPIISLPQAQAAAVQTAAPTALPTPIAVAKATPQPTPAPTVAAALKAPVAAAPVAAAPESRNEIVQGIVDRYRISGVRAAGADSKALVDGHVYKINEVIDRTIGLKLVKVDSDHLTFVDNQGGTYIRSF